MLEQAPRTTLTPGPKSGVHFNLPGSHRGVWNEAALTQTDDVVLAESLLDAMTFWSAGVRNVIAAYGVEGFTEDHWSALRRHGTRVVRIAYDRDEAGDRAAEKLSKELNAAGIDTYRVLFPKGMDANDYARAVQPANKSLPLAVRRAEWMGKGQRPQRAVAEAPTPMPALANYEREAREARDADDDIAAVMPEPIPSLAALSEPLEGAEAPPPAVPASAANASTTSAASVAVEGKGDELVFQFGERRWRVRGLGKNASYEAMRINLHVAHERTGSFHVDTVELYSARQRSAYQKAAASELELEERVIKHDVGSILLELERRQEDAIETALRPKTEEVIMTSDEREGALALLRDPFLVRRILEDFEACGVVGEETNKLVGYLAAVSRKLEEPLAIVIQSSSAAGKSRLMEAVLAMVPAEERVSFSAMTGQALFYMGAEALRHKILAIAEEEGAERASYALKLLQSEGELTIASTGKDPETGKLVTHTYRVEGPVMIFLTTTAIEVDEELLNRCIVLTVDEGTGQTRAIHKQQREAQTLSGLLRRKERTTMRAVHQNAQRLLRPLLVVNPMAEALTFSDLRTRTRRDHMKYLTMIRSIALLHQYQRPLRTVIHEGKEVAYIEVEATDIELANKLARAVLGRSLDELPPQTRALLEKLDALVEMRVKAEGLDRSDVRFSRRDAREWSGMGHTQLCVHLSRLESLEYVVMHRAARGQGLVYELSYAGESAPEVLYDRQAVGGLSGDNRVEVGPESGACRPAGERAPLDKKQGVVSAVRETASLALNGGRARASSYA